MTILPARSFRRILIELPARAVDAAVLGYMVLVAALTLICLASAALWGLLWLAGFPLP